MQGAYGGLVVILNYGIGVQAEEQDFSLITQDNQLILTQTSDEILVQE